MATRGRPRAKARSTYRAGLTKDQVFQAAVRVADERGIAALTMRNLAQELGVEAMSLYHHVADKGEVLAGMVDVVVSEISARVADIGAPPGGADGNWKTAVRHTILAAREVLLSHPWGPSVIESRTTMSPTVMRYYDSLIRLLRQGGLSVSLVHHAMHALGSRALGFTQELFAPDNDEDTGPDVAAIMSGDLADTHTSPKSQSSRPPTTTKAPHSAGATTRSSSSSGSTYSLTASRDSAPPECSQGDRLRCYGQSTRDHNVRLRY